MTSFGFLSIYPPTQCGLATFSSALLRHLTGQDSGDRAGVVRVVQAAQPAIAAGHLLDDDRLLADGLALLGWLLDEQTRDGHLSLTPAGGHGRGWTGPGFDQQPIEAAALLADDSARSGTTEGRQIPRPPENPRSTVEHIRPTASATRA